MTSIEQRIARLEALEEIRGLDARYCRALDDGEWDALVSLFTEDGEFIGLSRARGRAELRAFFAGLGGAGLTAFWHHVTNLEIIFDGDDSARTQSFLWQPCVQDGTPHIAAGRYLDSVRRIDGVWRYASKRVCFDYFVPLTEGWDHGRFSLASAEATYPGRRAG